MKLKVLSKDQQNEQIFDGLTKGKKEWKHKLLNSGMKEGTSLPMLQNLKRLWRICKNTMPKNKTNVMKWTSS